MELINTQLDTSLTSTPSEAGGIKTLSNDPVQQEKASNQLWWANTLTGVSASAKALASIAEGVSTYNNAMSRSAIYSANAASLRATIPYVQQQTEQKVGILQQETGQFIASQRAAMASAGIVVDQDTGLEAMVQSAGIGAREVVLALQASRQEIANIQNRANQQDFEAAQAKREAKAATVKGIFGVGTTILGAAKEISDAASKYKIVTGG